MADCEQTEEETVKPPIIMKIESTPEDNSKQENNDNEIKALRNNEDFKMCSPNFRSSISTTSTNPFALSQSKFSKGILKPPQLSLNNCSTSSLNKSSFVLKPSSLNPFASNSTTDNKNSDISDSDKRHVNGETLKFVPLIKTDADSKPVLTQPKQTTAVTNTTSSNTFVFGQNLQERVVAAENKPEEPKPSTSLNSNGTTDMLFSSVIKNEVKSDSSSKDKETKSLSESAREYEESRANKRKYEEVEVKTGEEEETNVLSISCKLFAFDNTSSNWQERGRGILRLNDFEIDNHTGSRLVFRTTGSKRVILNTKIWAEMTVDKASEKSVRLTALDSSGEVKVFLIMSSIEDSKHLYSHLQSRLEKEITTQKRKKVDSNSSSGEH